uniref:Uncharacterized protein n=1 Tax=Amphimedon queenslandica TaxID=400682 RepID=A0A1X7V230_AMPQE
MVLENKIVNKLCLRFETERNEDPPPMRMRNELSTPEKDTLSHTIAEGTPCVSVLNKKGKEHRVYRVTRSLRCLAKSVGRGSRKSAVNQMFKDASMRKDREIVLNETSIADIFDTDDISDNSNNDKESFCSSSSSLPPFSPILSDMSSDSSINSKQESEPEPVNESS